MFVCILGGRLSISCCSKLQVTHACCGIYCCCGYSTVFSSNACVQFWLFHLNSFLRQYTANLVCQFGTISCCCSAREVERGDREVWGSTGNNQIGIVHGALPVRYEYDTVLDETCSNQQVTPCKPTASCAALPHGIAAVITLPGLCLHLRLLYNTPPTFHCACTSPARCSLILEQSAWLFGTLTRCLPVNALVLMSSVIDMCRCTCGQVSQLCSQLWMASMELCLHMVSQAVARHTPSW